VIAQRLFGDAPAAQQVRTIAFPARASIRNVYATIIESDEFRAATGRIAASYAW
jgi:hypothetical protein